MFRSIYRAIAAVIVSSALLFSSAASAASAADEAAVRAIYDRFLASWNTPGMPGFEALFTPDADFVVISGQWLKGRDEIGRYHRALLKSHYAGSRLFVESVDVRFVRDDLAIVHLRSGAKYSEDGKDLSRTSLSTSTVIKAGGAWQIAAFHNTLTGGPGFAFGPAPVDRPQ